MCERGVCDRLVCVSKRLCIKGCVTVVYNKYVCVTGVCVTGVCVYDRCVVYVTVCVWVSV